MDRNGEWDKEHMNRNGKKRTHRHKWDRKHRLTGTGRRTYRTKWDKVHRQKWSREY